MKIRASSAHRLMGYLRDEESLNKNYLDSITKLNNKLQEKELTTVPINDDKEFYHFIMEKYKDNPPRGFKGLVNDYVKNYDSLFAKKELPEGAKSYLKEIFISQQGLELSLEGFIGHTQKGIIMEDDAIELVNDVLGTFYNKNEYRALYDLESRNIIKYHKENETPPNIAFAISGECDIYNEDQNVVRDIKCPHNFDSYTKHKGISTAYYWQLITYSLLWSVENLKLDFCLMETPFQVYEKFTPENQYKVRKFNQRVAELPLNKRLKTFEIPSEEIKKAQGQLLRRADMALAYYKTLNLDKLIYDDED